MLQDFFADFVSLWVVIDPFGTVPLFVILAQGMPAAVARSMARRSVLIAGGLLLGTIVLGQLLLQAMGISVASFQVAGGLILMVFALQMALGSGQKPGEGSRDPMQAAIFPLALPSIAGPGAIVTAIIVTDNERFGILEQARTAVALVLVLGLQWVLLRGATRVQQFLGASGINLLSRVMGLILAAVAVQHVITGLRLLFATAP